MKFENLNFHDAVSRLLNIQISHDRISWLFDQATASVEKYLVETRKIDAKIIRQLITINKIKQDKANCVCFLEYDENDHLNYIFRRSTTNGNPFKGEVRHSNKENSFQLFIRNNLILPNSKVQKIDKLYIVEGAIDACAMATLLKMKPQNNDLIKIITTAGHPHHSLKKRIEHDNPDEIIIATDMDDQGQKFIQIIKTMIGKVAWSAPIYDAKDPAELLQKIKGKSCV